MPEHEDLELLRPLRPSQEHDQLNETAQCQIDERPDHNNLRNQGAPNLPDARADAALDGESGF